MATPKKYKNKVNVPTELKGDKRKQQLVDKIDENSTNLPKGVLHEDLDLGFKDFVKNDLQLTLKNRDTPVPVIMMGIHGWNEYKKTWKLADKYGNVKIPYINIVRKPETKLSEDRMLIFHTPDNNLSGRRKYTYNMVPKWTGNKKIWEAYKIPEPIPVNIEYDVRLFAYRQSELNEFNKIVTNLFVTSPVYINVNGHYIPIKLINIDDESSIEDIESKRFYNQRYTFLSEGIILDPDEFEISQLSELKIKFNINS